MPHIPLHQMWQIYTPQSSIDALHTITPNLADLPPKDLPVHINGNFTFLVLQLIYADQLADLPPQLSIDALHTTTPNLADLPPPIEHRCLAYCYTKLGRSTPDLLADLPPIEHRCLAYHYTKLGRSTPDLLTDLPHN